MTTQVAADRGIRGGRSSSRLRAWAGRDGHGLLLAAALLFALLSLHFRPRSFTSLDESAYVNMAATLRHGTVHPDVAGVSVPTAFPVAGHLVSKYPLGMPAVLAAVSLFGWRGVLGTNLVVHLLTFWAVIRLLRRLELPAGYAVLFLLHPTAVLFSRTLMADPLSGLLLALAFDRHLARRPWATGLLVGASVLVRTGNVVAVPVFLAAALIGDAPGGPWRERLAAGAAFCAALLPFGLGAWYYAHVIAGGQMAQNTGAFGAGYFRGMFPGYALSLMLLYPGMLLAPALYRGRGRAVIGGLCYGFLLLYSFWYYRDQGQNGAETLIVGQRYFLAALPLWVVAYAALCRRLAAAWPARTRAALAVTGTALLLGLAGAISARHARYTSQLADTRDALLRAVPPGDTLVCNTQIAKLFYPGATVHWLQAGSGTPDVQTRSAVRKALRGPGGAVYFASWARAGRPDDQKEAAAVAALSRAFAAAPLSSGARGTLPPAVTVSRTAPRRN